MSNPEDNKIALIDIDGTLADYDRAMRDGLARLMGPMEGLPENLYGTDASWFEARMDLVKAQPGFWQNLPPIENGLTVYRLLGAWGFGRIVLTKGPKRTVQAWTEKALWCDEHVPEAGIFIVRGGDEVPIHKGLIYGKVLFDDFPPYVEQWLEHRPRGKVIMMSQPHNAGFQHPQVIKVPKGRAMQSNDIDRLKEFVCG